MPAMSKTLSGEEMMLSPGPTPRASATRDPITQSPSVVRFLPWAIPMARNSKYSSVVPTIGNPRAVKRT